MLHSPAVGGPGYGPVATDIETDMASQLWTQVSIDIAMIVPRYGYSYGRSSTNTALQPGLNKELFGSNASDT